MASREIGNREMPGVGERRILGGSVSPRTAVDRAYLHIKGEIIGFRLKPGDPLNETQLTESLGLSRTPIREALTRLQHEGLVRTVQYKGSFVALLAIEDLVEIYHILEILEGAAAFLAVGRVDLDQIELIGRRLMAANTSNPTPKEMTQLTEIDLEFHEMVLEACGNRRLHSIVEMLNNQVVRFRYVGSAYRPEQNKHELLSIIAALRGGDPQSAEKAMRQHIQGATQDIMSGHARLYNPDRTD